MLAVCPSTKAYLCLVDIDFRKGIDGLQAVCRNVIEKDPFSGMLFIFRNRKKTAIRILGYDGQGFWLCTKRLSKGRFSWWPEGGKIACSIEVCDLQALLWNGNPKKANFSKSWKKIC